MVLVVVVVVGLTWWFVDDEGDRWGGCWAEVEPPGEHSSLARGFDCLRIRVLLPFRLKYFSVFIFFYLARNLEKVWRFK